MADECIEGVNVNLDTHMYNCGWEGDIGLLLVEKIIQPLPCNMLFPVMFPV